MATPRAVREEADPTPQAPAAARGTGFDDIRFRALLGPARWAALAPAIRARFSKRLAGGRTAVYAGVIGETRMTRTGWLLAQAARVVGAPLPLESGAGLPATVAVTEDAIAGGQFWTRVYGRRRGFPQVIHSSKRFRGPTGLEEYLGHGLGMALTLRADGTALHFISDHYFVQVGRVRLRLPRWLSPGTTTVSHIDLGDGRFTFRLEVRHLWLGVLVRQAGVFHDVGDRTECGGRADHASPPLPFAEASSDGDDLPRTSRRWLSESPRQMKDNADVRCKEKPPHPRPDEPRSDVSNDEA